MTFARYTDDVDRKVSVRYTDNEDMQESDKTDDYSFDVRHSLPAPEEMQTDNVQRRPMSKKMMGLITMAVFCLTAIIGLSVSLSARRKSRAANASGAMKDLTPGDEDEFWSRHPDQDLTQRFQDVANFLNNFEYTDLKTMTTRGTPQYSAVKWMADEDPAELDVPESTDYDEAMDFVQRYVVVVFYYATNGDSWENQLNFLSDYYVCDWNEQIASTEEATVGNYDGWLSGVQCNSDGEVNYVFIRTYLLFVGDIRCGGLASSHL